MEILQIKLTDIIPTSDNKRVINKKSQGFKDLLKSIEAIGVQVPVHVRPHPTEQGKYELRAGQRRFTACQELKLETIPALNIADMTDEQAADLTFIENNFREDLPPLEQSAQIAVSLARHNGDVKAVAAAYGQSVSWVAMRAEVAKSLSPKWKKEGAKSDSDCNRWGIAHLALLARLPQSVQDEYLADTCFENNITVNELEKELAEYLMILSKAPWKVDDETLLPNAGACSKCQKRTSCKPTLFEDDTDDKVKKSDRCLDKKCWQQKMDAYVIRRASELSKEHKNLIFLGYLPKDNSLSKVFPKTYYEHDVEPTKKGSKNAVPALIVSGDNAGVLKWVNVERERTSSRPKDENGEPIKKSLKERRELLDAKRYAQVLIELQDVLDKTQYDTITVCESADNFGLAFLMMRMANAFGYTMADAGDDWKKVVGGEDAEKTLARFWDGLKSVLRRNLTWRGAVTQTPKELIAEAKQIAALIGVDIEAMFKDVSGRKGFTEPKSWADEVKSEKPKAENKKAGKVQKCKVCGCTEDKACVVDGEPCHWIKPNLCSACEGKESPAKKVKKSKSKKASKK